MIVFDLVGETETHTTYQRLATSNLERQYDFLRSIIEAALSLQHAQVSEETIYNLNYHAIVGLHERPGVYRTTAMKVGVPGQPPEYIAPPSQVVPSLMTDFVSHVNKEWNDVDAVALAAYCLWRLNFIHPFVNGNGRTARALCYYVLCVKFGYLLPGEPIVPELIRRDRGEYIAALRKVDKAEGEGKAEDGLPMLTDFVSKLLTEQLS